MRTKGQGHKLKQETVIFIILDDTESRIVLHWYLILHGQGFNVGNLCKHYTAELNRQTQ